MKLVPENINENIKHLSGRTEEEQAIAWDNMLQEIFEMDSIDAISRVYAEVRDFEKREDDPPVSWKRIASQILDNVSPEERKQAITQVMNDYFFG